jgi:hypothetical protein
MPECEFCGEEVENPSHCVVNGRIFTNDPTTCAECGWTDEELIEHVKEHQPGSLSLVRERLEEDNE